MIEYKGKQVLISDILHDAADIFLRYNIRDTAPRYQLVYTGGHLIGKYSLQKSVAETKMRDFYPLRINDLRISWNHRVRRLEAKAEICANGGLPPCHLHGFAGYAAHGHRDGSGPQGRYRRCHLHGVVTP